MEECRREKAHGMTSGERRYGETASRHLGTSQMFRSPDSSRKARAVTGSLTLFAALTTWCLLSIVSPSLALKTGRGSDFSLGGSATIVNPGSGSPSAAELTSIGSGESHVNIAIPAKLKLRQLTTLSTDYKFVLGTCGLGSPRFTANVTNGTRSGSVFFYIGPSNGGCGTASYTNTGNLAAPASIVDASRLPGGSLSQPFSSVQAAFGDYAVTAVHIDVDGGELGSQVLDFDNTTVNGRVVTYEPQHGISVLMERTAGNIKVKKPGKRGFKNLKKVETVPVNSVVDTRGGRVEVTAAVGKFANTTPDNSMVFYDGVIRLQQGAARNAAAVAKLVGKLPCRARAGGQAKAGKSSEPLATTSRKRRKRRVWGSGSGNYATSGGGGTGSVRGTTWLTRDTCHGTFFRVKDGIGISVRDFDLHRTVQLGPGQSYFARNR